MPTTLRSTGTTFNAAYASSAAEITPPDSTGKERDTESGNDYMFARYYNSATGRFLSPDWDAKSDDPVPYAKLDNPQSLNLYSYVLNNPVTTEDPDGHCPLCIAFEDFAESPAGEATGDFLSKYGDKALAVATVAVTAVAVKVSGLADVLATPVPGLNAVGGKAGNLSPAGAQNLLNELTEKRAGPDRKRLRLRGYQPEVKPRTSTGGSLVPAASRRSMKLIAIHVKVPGTDRLTKDQAK